MDTRMIRHKLLLDVGGTFIKCSDGRSIPVDSNGTREQIIASFKEAVGDMSQGGKVALAIPGPFDYENGRFLMKHKYASVYGETFASLVEAPETVEFNFIHDVNAMLLGEIASGEGAGYVNVALVALGTGLGFAQSLDGVIQTNHAGSPAVSIYSRPYGDGTLEDYVSKRGLLRIYREISGKDTAELTVKLLSERSRKGDVEAAETFRQAGMILGKTIAPILEELSIDCLLFGGQISRSLDLMRPGIMEELSHVACLKHISRISDFDNATFNGLSAL